MTDVAAVARAILDEHIYMTLATADENGRPWASPVWYAADDYSDFYWVSSSDATHSRNIAARAEAAIVVFDSRVAPGTGQGVYMRATAQELTGDELEKGIEVFSRVSQKRDGDEWTVDDVQEPALHRLYRARVSEHSVLDKEVRGVDRRTRVQL